MRHFYFGGAGGLLSLAFCFSAPLFAQPLSGPPPIVVCADELRSAAFFFSDVLHTARIREEGKVFLVEDDPILRTSILAGAPERFENSDSVMLMMPGMGGAAKTYGIAATAGQYSLSMLNMNVYPVALQNWVYFGASPENPAPDTERRALFEQYSRLPAQMAALTEFLGKLVDGAAAHGKKVSILTRSNGTGLILQWLSDAAKKGGEAYRISQGISAVFVCGLNSPLERHRKIWIAAEEDLEARKPGSLDPYAKEADRALYAQFTWADSDYNAAIVTDRHLPPVVAMIAARDEFVPAALQIEVMELLHRGHPELPLILYYSDIEHDPLRGYRYSYLADDGTIKKGKARSGEHFKRAYQSMFGSSPTLHAAPGELKRVILPQYAQGLREVPTPP